jgi:hypothetical protein
MSNPGPKKYKLIFEKMKNKNLYNLSFRANSSFGSRSSWRPIPNSNFEIDPNSIPILDFFSKFKTDDLGK